MAKTRVIGLDIGTTHVRAAELEFPSGRPEGTPTLVRFHEAPLPLGAVRDAEVTEISLVSGVIKNLWAEAKFSSRDCVIGVGNQRVVVRELELPWMPASQIRASLPFQVQDLLPMASSEALLDYWPTGEFDGPAGRMLNGMLVAASRDTVNANILAVEGAGLRARMVDLNAFALLRGLARGDLAQRTVALVDIGAKVTNVVIAAHGVPRFVRTLPAGGQDVTEAVARAMSIAIPEAEGLKRQLGVGFAVPPEYEPAGEALSASATSLVESIRNTFVYFAANNHGLAIDVAVLTGGGASLPGLGQYLASASRLPVTLGNPLSGVKVGPSAGQAFAGQESLLAMSVGLAYGVAA